MAKIVDYLSESYQDTSYSVYYGIGQSFTGDGGTLDFLRAYLKKEGTINVNIYAKIYAHTGTFGDSGVPTGSALATSDAVATSGIDTDFELVDFTFSGAEKITLTNGTKYFVVLSSSYIDTSNKIVWGLSSSADRHAGQIAAYNGSSWFSGGTMGDYDCCFYIYRDEGSSPSPSQSPSQSPSLSPSSSGSPSQSPSNSPSNSPSSSKSPSLSPSASLSPSIVFSSSQSPSNSPSYSPSSSESPSQSPSLSPSESESPSESPSLSPSSSESPSESPSNSPSESPSLSPSSSESPSLSPSSSYSPSASTSVSAEYVDEMYVDAFIYVEDIDKLDYAKIVLSSEVGVKYAELDATSLLDSGWNQIHVLKSSFTDVGGINWASLIQVDLVTKAITGEDVYCIFDEVRFTDQDNYPRRYFDIGLQDIPVAWWAGNTALYEIQTACEAEGSRFYADENGGLHFENRQFYNLHAEYKVSQWQFSFDRMTDMEFPGRETDIINNVIIRLKPRKVVASAEEIWRYGFIPSIATSVTKTIWASLIDPCPTTTDGIVSPVATTDYTANTQEDGLGTDKTANVSVSITRFANAVKIDVTNNDAGTIYLTMLKIRGTPAKESDEIVISYQDDDSVAIYGKRPKGGYVIENKYMADETYALTLAELLVDRFKDPQSQIILKARAVPQLQLGDMITINDPLNDYNYLHRIVWMKTRISVSGGMEQEIRSRMVMPQETLTYFEIGESDIGSSDVIAP